METLIVAAIASVVAFSVFFCVFLLRQRGAGRNQPIEGCGGSGGGCQCRRAEPEGPANLPGAPLGAGSLTARCPHDAADGRRPPESRDHRPA